MRHVVCCHAPVGRMKKLTFYSAAVLALVVCLGVPWRSSIQTRPVTESPNNRAKMPGGTDRLGTPSQTGMASSPVSLAYRKTSTPSPGNIGTQDSRASSGDAHPNSGALASDRYIAGGGLRQEEGYPSPGPLHSSESLPTQWISSSPRSIGSQTIDLDSASSQQSADDRTEASQLTEQLSMQSFDSFYAVLFDPKADFSTTARGTSAASQPSMYGASIAGGAEGNPFAEAISNLKKDPLPSSPAAKASTGVNGQSASQNSGTASSTKPDASSSNPTTKPITPADPSPHPKTPTPQVTIPGGAKPFTIVGDIGNSGVGGIFPSLRLQSNQFEIPQLGLVNLKLSIFPDIAYSLTTVLVDDLNGDDLPDVAMARGNEPTIMTWLSLPNGDLIYAGASPIPMGARSLAAGDFNNDSRPDIAVVRESDSKTVDILYGLGDGRFAYTSTTQLGGESDMLVSGDIDDNGRLDLFGTNVATYKSWVLFGGGAALEFLRTTFSFTNMPTAQSLQDINLDSRLDQLILYQSRTKLSVVLNPPRSLVIRHVATINLRYSVVVVLGDILGEGFIDLGVSRLKR